MQGVLPDSAVLGAGGLIRRPVLRPDSLGDDVEHEQSLEGLQVPRLEEEPLELGVELPLQCLIPRSEDRNVMLSHGLLEGLEEEGLLNELGELGVVRVEEGYEYRVGVDLPGRRVRGGCGRLSGGGWSESQSREGGGKGDEEDGEEQLGDAIDVRTHNAMSLSLSLCGSKRMEEGGGGGEDGYYCSFFLFLFLSSSSSSSSSVYTV